MDNAIIAVFCHDIIANRSPSREPIQLMVCCGILSATRWGEINTLWRCVSVSPPPKDKCIIIINFRYSLIVFATGDGCSLTKILSA